MDMWAIVLLMGGLLIQKKLVGTWTTKDPASPWDGMSEPIKFWSRMFFRKDVVMKRLKLKLKLKLMAILLIQKKILQKGCMPRPEEVSSVTPLISRTHAHTCTHTHTHAHPGTHTLSHSLPLTHSFTPSHYSRGHRIFLELRRVKNKCSWSDLCRSNLVNNFFVADFAYLSLISHQGATAKVNCMSSLVLT